MLGFFSSKTAHPLADPREAKRILAGLATGTPLTVAEEATGWLESVAADVDLKMTQRLDLVLKLDEVLVAPARRLARDFPTLGAAGRLREMRQWEVGHGYWQALADAYSNCIVRYREAEKEDVVRPERLLLYSYGRLINALAAQLKWKQFRYGSGEPEFWQKLGGTYLDAVDAKLEQKSLSLYAGSGETTIEAEYLKVLFFQATSMDKLQPLQIEIAESLIIHFLPFFSLVREVRPENVYWVDAGKPLPPTRLARLPEITPTLRFFNGTRAVAAVAKTIKQIRSEGRVPPDITLGVHYEPDTVIPVLEHVAMYWAPKPPMRSNVRRRINAPLKLINGLAAVHHHLAGQPGSNGTESWVIDDVSLGGMGAHAVQSRRDWIRIGVLVGVQPEGGENWLIGVVRRYIRGGANQDSIGIETISKSPRAVFADAGGLRTEALLLDLPEVGKYARMALPADALEDGMALLFSVDGKNARLHPQEILATGPDFVVVNFFVQSYS